MTISITCQVNGTNVSLDIEPRTTLVDALRQNLGLTGTHVGCAHGSCGACTVLLDDHAIRGCLMLAVQAQGHAITTIEGLSNPETLTPLQASFRKHGALQCGFCTPGMVVTAHAVLRDNPTASADEIRESMSGNLCRCTGYVTIVEAVLDARPAYQTPANQESPQ